MKGKEDWQELKHWIRERSLQISEVEEFTLSSGRKSRFYINLKNITFHPPTLHFLASVILDFIRDEKVDAVGGLTLGADPIAFAVSLASLSSPCPIKPFVVRKETKSHGILKRIEGDIQPGERVIILEDVATTGNSCLTAAQAAKEAGLQVLYVLAVVDRQEGARETLKSAGFSLRSLLTLSDLLAD